MSTIVKVMALTIVPFEAKYSDRFRDLNLEWLDTYFYVEEKDRQLLEHSQKTIIDPGGHIFLALWQSEAVGCFALIPSADGVYELGKMAVDPLYRGQNFGQELMRFAISFARNNRWRKIVLYSSTKLPSALHIYRKFGFREVVLEKELPYARSDIKMELSLEF